MSRKNTALLLAQDAFERLCEPESIPVSFVYAEKQYHGLGGLEVLEKTITQTPKGTDCRIRAALDANVQAIVEASYCAEFGQMEYTLYFENTGSAPSEIIRDVYALDARFAGRDGVLRGILGDHDNAYRAYESDLAKGDVYYKSVSGRATHVVFPYFDLVHGDGGSMIAIGWAGTWDALFMQGPDCVEVKAKTCLFLRTALLPGEKIRTGLIVILPYSGRNADDAANLWREWFIKYNMPRADAQGDPIEPFSTTMWALDTGLPNSDGSISERHFTWKPTLDKLLAEGIHHDFRWFDAGWYFDPAGNSVEKDWWGTIGSWELDTEKWPDGSLRESVDACHAAGMKTFVWFEPERVTHVEDLAKNYGYKPEWGITAGGKVITNNIGDEECLEWIYQRITKMMKENDIDLYREDNNSNPVEAWGILDHNEIVKTGLMRAGISENKCICGHYKLWDKILAFCAENGKCTFLDSCASGGGRNDIESMRRSIPFLRSDADRTTAALRLSMTASFCKWIPFHGSATKETEHELVAETGQGSSTYVSRASFLPVMNYQAAYVHNENLDYDLYRANFNEWKSVRHLLTKDLYVLTPWHHRLNLMGWTAFAYDDPESGESVLLAFRMEDCREDTFAAKLPFADPGRQYRVTNADTGESITVDGEQLAAGYAITLPEPKSSALLRIWRL